MTYEDTLIMLDKVMESMTPREVAEYMARNNTLYAEDVADCINLECYVCDEEGFELDLFEGRY